MCQFASGFFKPDTMEVVVAELDSHEATAAKLQLKDGPRRDEWREFHYTPQGWIVCRALQGDSHTKEECASALRARWPRFADFFNWALAETKQTTEYTGYLDLSDCDLTGIQLPESVGGFLVLSGCDLRGINIPANLKAKVVVR